MTVEVVVGVVGRPHGVRGEVAVEPRTDEPDRRFAPGSELRTEGSSRYADRGLDAPSLPDGCWSGSRVWRIGPPSRRYAARAWWPMSTRTSDRRSRRSSTTGSWSGLRVRTAERTRSARWSPCCTCPAQDLLEIRTDDRASGWCPFVAALVPEVDLERRHRSPSRTVAGLLGEATRALMRIDVVSIFPSTWTRSGCPWSARPCETGLVPLGVHDLRQWTHDRHRTVDDTPYGGGAGMVMRPEPWGEALDAAGHAADPAGPADPVRAHLHPGHGRRAGGRGAPDPGLRPLRGDRRPGGRRTRRPGCGWTS